jgi:uncharacterized C2H2 Zn-finger protein
LDGKGQTIPLLCPCDGCGQFFGRRYDLSRHVRGCHQGASAECPLCKKILSRPDAVTRHQRSRACKAKAREQAGGSSSS